MQQQPVQQLVVVGASAGGIEALSAFVSNLPPDFVAPIVIAQHLDPSRESHLQEILARRSKIPVRTVTDRETLASGTVYVVPSNRHVEITDNSVSLPGDEVAGRPKPSIDFLLGSAAQIFGENLYAVILTGSGSDGADGARQVKEAGGTVIIQNPETASFPSMPLSLAPTTVDIVAELETLGALLQELLTGAHVSATSEEDRRMRTLLDQLRARSGIDFSAYRANSFLIQVTDFFRDVQLYVHIRDRVLPGLIDYARAHDKELRIWSAGCATGEEAYSLAILVAEAVGDDLENFNVRVFATDVNADSVVFGRRGVYTPAAVKNVPPALLDRYFTPLDGTYEVKRFVRRFVVFGQHDLSQRSPFPRTDLVLCRNVLIYFTPELQRRALQLFAFSLRTGGRLILGKSEASNPFPDYFVLEEHGLNVYRRHGERIVAPPRLPAQGLTLDPGLSRRSTLMRRRSPQLSAQEAAGPSVGERAERLLLELPIGVAIIDRHYDIQAINTAARGLLGIHTSAIGEDFIHLARRVPSDLLREAIDRAFQGHISEKRIPVQRDISPDEPQHLSVSCFPQDPSQSSGAVERVTIIVSDVTQLEEGQRETARRERDLQVQLADLTDQMQRLEQQTLDPAEIPKALSTAQGALNTARAEIDRLNSLVAGLEGSRQELTEANAELTEANTLLRGQNEELIFSAEEAQAAVEEVETLNEEQQATNEELETLNEELQATVEELNTTNDDLEARGEELRTAANTLEIERSRLSVILTNMEEAVALVGGAGEPILTNPAFARFFGRDAAGLRPEDESGDPIPSSSAPLARAAHGEIFTMQFTVPGEGGTRRHFEATGTAVEGGPGEGVVVIRDINESSLLQTQTAFLAQASHELNNPLTTLGSSLQLLSRQVDPAQRHFIDLGLSQVRLLRDLVQHLTDVVRLQEGKFQMQMQEADVAQVVAESVELLQTQAEDQELRVQKPAGPVLMHCDPQRMQQVLVNLLNNALKYGRSPKGVDVRLARDDQDVLIEVQDYGAGIPARELPNIFTRFYQAPGGRVGGLGLGLHIAKEIVEAHNGTIEVLSQSGAGTLFRVRLPAG